jgi:O-antigen ligase
MEYAVNSNLNYREKPFFLLIISIIFSNYSIEVGFALKPFMILSIIFFVLEMNRFVIHRLRAFEVILLLFFVYYCSTGLFAEYRDYSLRMIMGILLVLFCYFVMRYITSLASINIIEKFIHIGGFVYNGLSIVLYFIGLASLNFSLVGNKIIAYGVEMDRNFPRLIGLTSDPNLFSLYNMIFFFYYLTHLDKKWAKWGLLLSTVTMLLTLSRGGIVAIAFGILLMFLTSNTAKKLKMLIILPLTTLILNILINIMTGINMLTMITDRFLINDGGSGRSNLWGVALQFFQEHPIFGIGIFNFLPYGQEKFGAPSYLHNSYLEVLVESGLIGFSLYLLVFISVIVTYYNYRKKINDKGYLFFTFISISVFMATYSLIVNEVFYFVLALFWRYLYEIKHPSKEEVPKDTSPIKKKKQRKKYKIVW